MKFKIKITPRTIQSNVKGINSTIPYVVRLSSKIPDWSFAFNNIDFEEQRFGTNDSDDCWEFSFIEDLTFQIELFLSLKQLPQTHIDFLTIHGYFNSQGQLSISRRFLAILSKVKDTGGDATLAWSLAQEYGVIPRTMCDFTPTAQDNANRDTFISNFYNENDITPMMLALGKQFLDYFSLEFEYIGSEGITPPLQDLIAGLYQSPLQIIIPIPHDVSKWNNQCIDYDGSTNPAHLVVLYKIDYINNPKYPYFIYDQYYPILKQLSADYLIYQVVNGVCTPRIIPPQTVPVTAMPYPSKQNVYTKIWQAIWSFFN
jgi:hypothetical protein